MATVTIDPQRVAAEQILLYCGVPLKAIHQKLTNWGRLKIIILLYTLLRLSLDDAMDVSLAARPGCVAWRHKVEITPDQYDFPVILPFKFSIANTSCQE